LAILMEVNVAVPETVSLLPQLAQAP